jgi:hypothetical protein
VIRGRHPEPSLRVEGHLDRLLDIGLAGDQLHVEARGDREGFPLVGGREGIGRGDERRSLLGNEIGGN